MLAGRVLAGAGAGLRGEHARKGVRRGLADSRHKGNTWRSGGREARGREGSREARDETELGCAKGRGWVRDAVELAVDERRVERAGHASRAPRG